MPGTRKLGRATSHRTAMLRAMVTFLLENGKIETTVTRAKEVRSLAEKMITIAKTNDLHSKRLVMGFVTKEAVTNKLFTEIAPKYADRNGGYTRMDRAAAMQLRWRSLSSSKFHKNRPRTKIVRGFFAVSTTIYMVPVFWSQVKATIERYTVI